MARSVFRRQADGAWSPGTTLTSGDAAPVRFGDALSLTSQHLFVGAPNTSSLIPQTGAVYVFSRSGPNFVPLQKIEASFSQIHNWFGHALDADGGTLVVGAPA